MPYNRLKAAKKRAIGTKQTTKAVAKGEAAVVYVACNAEAHIINPLLALCRERGVEVCEVESMQELGKACGIEVGSASAAILEE
mgnify:CR=1 FL=1